MNECFDKKARKIQYLKDGVILTIGDDQHFYDKCKNLYNLSVDQIRCPVWQIIPAKPVVLSANDFWNNVRNGDFFTDALKNYDDSYDVKDICEEIFKEGDQNGQLREWLRPEQVELREACKEYVTRSKIVSFSRIRKALENLKPPCEQ
jgi:hypothetical protein